MTQLTPRLEPYPPSLRAAKIGAKQGNELFLTIKTRNCSWGGCTFCGLGKLDGEHPVPLSMPEAIAQWHSFYINFLDSKNDPEKVLKLSVIGMTDSLLNPRTIQPDALKAILEVSSRYLPNVREVGVESRADMADPSALERASAQIESGFGEVSRELAIGIETADEAFRNKSLNKGITDACIEQVCRKLSEINWKLRGYFIYNLPGVLDRVDALKSAVDFMARVRDKTSAETSIYVIPGYAPQELKDNEFFKSFMEASDASTLSDLKQAAVYANERMIKLEIDSCSVDRAATGAGAMGSNLPAALDRYNLTLNPEELK